MPRWSLKNLGLLFGPIAAIIVYFLLASSSFSGTGRTTVAIATLMAVWWLTEAVPIPVTALLPIVLFPALGAGEMKKVTAPYAHPLIFLFLGGFLIATASERWDLHRRFALMVLKRVGNSPARLVAGFMAVTAFISLWVSNTSTVMMMLPIATSVLAIASAEDRSDHFGICLMLGLAYAASIGGIGTLIGTPPNALLAAFVVNQYGTPLTFAGWLKVGLPFVVILLPICWFLLTRIVFPIRKSVGKDPRPLFEEEFKRLGPMTRAEKTVLTVFLLTAFLWIFRSLLARWLPLLSSLDDSGVAMIGGLSLFFLSAGGGKRILDWERELPIPWGILLLFGGGLSLAEMMTQNGVTEAIGRLLSGLGTLHPLILIFLVTTLMVFLSELTSNTAQTAAFLPILGAVAAGIGMNPLHLLIPATIAVSTAFMLPAGTPPNALVFASGKLTIAQMCRAGFLLNWVSILVTSLVSYFLGDFLF